ncbi:tRNA lysidine(34) synthetase TilS [uncultured Maritalea sp.]|jgi:tRNA(Ile)-lysidine synthase|uniref:tRNA lysidine(34) synthetase TilS n=1 Tax=uncultured Maritalea sp. TaxID=757249 RepID=UPI002624349D|nr:tRNA lysidine(34) synthetase TilS [uncultured Maritalea sp.]
MLSGPITDFPLDDPDRVSLLFAPVQNEHQLGLAVSGGADSLALMLLVARWCELQDTPPKVVVFSVDHGLREAAKLETKFVATVAEDLGFDVQILVGQIDNPQSRLQEKARALRYGLIGNAMEELGINCLLTGHHSDDQAETVMMRLSRGSGVSGLGGMAKISVREGLFVFRPLLDVTHLQLEAFVRANDLTPVDDPSNTDAHFERVRWRSFMPKMVEAGLSANMIGLSAKRLRRADQALNELTEQLYEDQFVIDPFGCLFFDLSALIKQPTEIGIRLLARALDDAGGATQMPTLSQVETLYEHLQAGIFGFKGLTLGGCGITLKDGIVQIFREAGRLRNESMSLVAGSSVRWDNRFQIIVAQDRTSPVCVAPAIEITRNMLDTLLPGLAHVPMQAVQAAPLIVADQQILAIGEHVLADGVDIFRVFGPNALI